MGGFQELIRHITNMKLTDYIDIIVLAFLIYKVFPLFRSSGASRIAKAVIVVLIVSWITDWLDMYAIHFVIEQVTTVGLIALVILFQPELRRILDHIGNVKLKKLFSGEYGGQEMEGVITQTIMACEQLSREKVGALIVFSRDNPLDEYIKTGTMIDGQLTEQLIRNIFFPKAALHDGAMIVRDGRVTAAGCVLPLSHSKRLSADLGTRHRAGVGMSEASDAVVVIVSEETGTISVAVGGMLKRHLAPQMLERLLRNELMPETAETKKRALKLPVSAKEGKHEK
ncbi:MAG: diadenylate cyclase CdaA [Oscillospiraceae bacterium]|nr:diadenylate cyclase CdaA [Oscillospiraceae bacterium]